MSLAPLPRRLSSPLVPLKVSGPSVPILLIANATPLATKRVRAIVANNTMVRLIIYPSSFAYSTVSSEVGVSGRSRRAHADHNLPLPFCVSHHARQRADPLCDGRNNSELGD